MPRPRLARLAAAGALALVAALAPGGAARAGAWTLTPGEGLAIVTLRHV